MPSCLGQCKPLTVTCPIRSWRRSGYTKVGWNKHEIALRFDVVRGIPLSNLEKCVKTKHMDMHRIPHTKVIVVNGDPDALIGI